MIQVHETYNMTPYVADMVFSKDRSGKHLVIAVLKASFEFDEKGECITAPREGMLPVFKSDVYHGPPERSGVKYPEDSVPEKTGTDIVIHGHAYGHGQKKVICGFEMGDLTKKIAVFGRRFWVKRLTGLKISEPLPFDKIPLLYDHAFGGSYDDPEKGPVHFEENPIGKGFGTGPRDQTPLPDFEYPDMRITSLKSRPAPAGLGAIPRSWKQRVCYAGTYDDNWRTLRFPFPPLDMKPRFYNAVPDDQIFLPKLQGHEKLTLFHLYRSKPEFTLRIPKQTFICTLRIKQETLTSAMVIDTCLVEPDERRLTLTFACRLPVDSDVRYLKSVHFEKETSHEKSATSI